MLVIIQGDVLFVLIKQGHIWFDGFQVYIKKITHDVLEIIQDHKKFFASKKCLFIVFQSCKNFLVIIQGHI